MSNNFESMSDYLKGHSIMTLATIDSEGKPVLDTLDYMWTGKSLFFFTDGRSRKAVNITKNNFISAMVAEQDVEFFKAKSVEIHGHISKTDNPADIQAYMQDFMTRRPQFASLPPNPDMQMNMHVYEIKPNKLRMLDNSVAPGHIDEIIL
jgi:general stress protein 26